MLKKRKKRAIIYLQIEKENNLIPIPDVPPSPVIWTYKVHLSTLIELLSNPLIELFDCLGIFIFLVCAFFIYWNAFLVIYLDFSKGSNKVDTKMGLFEELLCDLKVGPGSRGEKGLMQ